MAVTIGLPEQSTEVELRIALTLQVVRKFAAPGAVMQVQAVDGAYSR